MERVLKKVLKGITFDFRIPAYTLNPDIKAFSDPDIFDVILSRRKNKGSQTPQKIRKTILFMKIMQKQENLLNLMQHTMALWRLDMKRTVVIMKRKILRRRLQKKKRSKWFVDIHF